MRKVNVGMAQAVLIAFVLVVGPGAVSLAEYVRRTAIVEAVEKTRKSIIVINCVKRNQSGVKKNVAGTGVIVDERGYAVTNRHVVHGAEKLEVTLFDDTETTATVVATDPATDLAILKLSRRRKYDELGLAPASDLMVGETVITVGNPLGFTNTVSTGIVSAVGRDLDMGDELILEGLIQTNASINPGNSGGPLLNINGELIGITVATHQGAQGISFAINADTVKDVLRRHLSASKMSKVTHGLKTEEKVESKGKERQKVVVASAAGDEVKKGDVIVTVGSLKVHNRFDLERALWGYKAGEKVEVSVVRQGKPIETTLTLSGTDEVASSSRGR